MAHKPSPPAARAPAAPPVPPAPPSWPRNDDDGDDDDGDDDDRTVPLDDPSRTHAIHAALPSVRVTAATARSATNPLTLRPFSAAELARFNFDQVLAEGRGLAKADVARLRDEAARALQARIAEREARVREIDKEIEEKEKIREVERKVYRKKMEGRASEGGK